MSNRGDGSCILNSLTIIVSLIISCDTFRNLNTVECEKFLRLPIILVGVFLAVFSLVCLVSACFRVYPPFWVHALVIFVCFVLILSSSIFFLVVTFSDSNSWLKKRFDVDDVEYWNKMKTCMVRKKFCKDTLTVYGTTPTLAEFRNMDWSAVQQGCCKPPDECNFVYVSPLVWNKSVNNSTNSTADCGLWGNDASTLCFDCGLCKVGFLDSLKDDWITAALLNTVSLSGLGLLFVLACRLCFSPDSQEQEQEQEDIEVMGL